MRSNLIAVVISFTSVTTQAHNNDHMALAIPLRDIVIDGRLDDWPSRMLDYPVAWVSTAYKNEPPYGPEDLTASFRVGYSTDDDLLYLALVLRDDDRVVNPQNPSWTEQDLCEIYIDADHSGGNSLIPTGQEPHQYVMVAGNSRYGTAVYDNPALNRGDTRNSGVSGTYLRLGNYTVYEWAIPLWDRLPDERHPIRIGDTIGFDVAVSDADSHDSGNWVAWTSGKKKVANSDFLGDLTFAADLGGQHATVKATVPDDLEHEYQRAVEITGIIHRAGSTKHRWHDAVVLLQTPEGETIEQTITDSLGYHFWVGPGTYLLVVQHSDDEPVFVKTEPGKQRITCDISTRLARVSGRVFSPRDATPWAEVTVTASQGADKPIRRIVTDSHGRYSLWLMPGSYELAVADAEGAEPSQIDLTAGEDSVSYDFTPEAVGNVYHARPILIFLGFATVVCFSLMVPLYQQRVELGGLVLAPALSLAALAENCRWQRPAVALAVAAIMTALVHARDMLDQGGTANDPMATTLWLVGIVMVFPGMIILSASRWVVCTAVLWVMLRTVGHCVSFSALLAVFGWALVPSALCSATLLACATGVGYPQINGLPTTLSVLLPTVNTLPTLAQNILAEVELFYLWSLFLTVAALRSVCNDLSARGAVLVVLSYWTMVTTAVTFGAVALQGFFLGL